MAGSQFSNLHPDILPAPECHHDVESTGHCFQLSYFHSQKNNHEIATKYRFFLEKISILKDFSMFIDGLQIRFSPRLGDFLLLEFSIVVGYCQGLIIGAISINAFH